MFVSREMIGTGADGRSCKRGADAAARRARPTRSGSGEQIQDARLQHLLLGEAGGGQRPPGDVDKRGLGQQAHDLALAHAHSARGGAAGDLFVCLLYTSPSPRD